MMKRLCPIFLLPVLLLPAMQAQNGINWSAPVTVASNLGDKSPRIAVLKDGSPFVLWGQAGTSPKIYSSRWENGAFTSATAINTGNIQPDLYNFGGLDMAATDDSIFLVFEHFNNGVYLVRSTDGGATFGLPTNVFDPPAGIWLTLPSIEITQQGHPIISVIQELTNETQARYITLLSEDGGQSFLPPVTASLPADGEFVCECCPSDMVTDGGNIWLIFRNNNNNLRDVWVSRSEDGGQTFGIATDVDATDWILNACPISGPVLSPLGNDSLLSVWMSDGLGTGSVYISTLHGGTMQKGWEMELPHATLGSSQNSPDAAGKNDTIGITWVESGFGPNHSEVMFAFSNNGAPDLASNIANLTNAPGNQRYPSMAYNDGIFHLVYADGFGAITYRRGIISETSASQHALAAVSAIKILNQPAKDFLQLEVSNPPAAFLDFTLHDLNGRTVKSWVKVPVEGQVATLGIEAVSPGFYVLQCTTAGVNLSIKAVLH